MSVKRLPREMGMWLCCDGTDDEGCKERTFSAPILASNNREWFKKNGGWGRGLRKGYKRRDLCPKCMVIERELFAKEQASTEAWKKQRAERVREDAAIACSMMACDRAYTYGGSTYYFEIAGLGRAAFLLAEAAHNAARTFYGRDGRARYHLEYAEAEALLRTGFVPEGWR